MATTDTRAQAPGRSAVVLALRLYGRELSRLRRLALPALLLPAVGNIGIRYVAPLLVAKLAGQAAEESGLALAPALPYVLGFGAALLLAEAVWRIGQHCLNRVGALGMEHLYVLGMDELLAKDAAFFHDNFSGSLTKRVLSFGRRFEDFVDTVTYRIVGSLVPLVFGAVVLWHYEPLLVAGLLLMIALTVAGAAPLIRVAHRLSTVAGMDRLVVLDRGRVVEQGTHGELLATGGAYAKLWRHQSGGFLGESAGPAPGDDPPAAGLAGLPGPPEPAPDRGRKATPRARTSPGSV